MSSKKLFVFEGQKTEINITKNLANQFSDSFPEAFSSENVECAYCTTIYNLYKALSEDEYLDVFMLLKEIDFNKKTLENYSRDDFAEIYLFFDYDGHTPIASDEKLTEIISLFDVETRFGKIFISYPMVEALKHFSPTIDFKNLKVDAKTNINYKNIVHNECDQQLQNFTTYNRKIWIQLIDVHLKKMNYIVNNLYSMPSQNVSQIEIFINQQAKYLKIDSSIAVLSAFPVFIFDYYGKQGVLNIFESEP